MLVIRSSDKNAYVGTYKFATKSLGKITVTAYANGKIYSRTKSHLKISTPIYEVSPTSTVLPAHRVIKDAIKVKNGTAPSLLQSKHYPHEAMHKYTMLLSTVRDLWRGQEMERVVGSDGVSGGWRSVTDKNGKPVQATTQQWQRQLIDMYSSPDGLNIPGINSDHVREVATALTGVDGRIRDIDVVGKGTDRVGDQYGQMPAGSKMDKLAYGGTFADVCAVAHGKENLFTGSQNALFAPVEIMRNVREREAYERRLERAADPTRDVPGPEYVPLSKKDVRAEYVPQVWTSRATASFVSSIGAPAAPALEPQASCEYER